MQLLLSTPPDVGMMTPDKTDTSVLDECTLADATDTDTTIVQLWSPSYAHSPTINGQ